MKTCELFKKKTTLSFEVFPPKSSTPVESIYSTISQLQPLNPDFISVTYGAGGSANNATIDICSAIKKSPQDRVGGTSSMPLSDKGTSIRTA